MTKQLDIFGNQKVNTSIAKEIEAVANKYPAYVREKKMVGSFFFAVMKERYPWIVQNETYSQDLKEFAEDITSIDRCRRDYIVKDKERAKGF